MNKTGNVFADALIKAGAIMEGKTFDEWGSVGDFKFPFSTPYRSSEFYYNNGWVDIFNVVRKTSKDVDYEWIKSREAVNTDNILLTWMKSNTSLLRIVDNNAVKKFELSDVREYFSNSGVRSYRVIPEDYTEGLAVHIVYNVMRAEFVLVVNNIKYLKMYDTACSLTNSISILNCISEHRDSVEFIPVIINDTFTVSHRSYFIKGTEIPEVSISYVGRDITKNENIMNRLSEWLSEGNTINPRSRYFILASKGSRGKCYLRKDKVGD